MKEIYSERIKKSLGTNKKILVVILILSIAIIGCIIEAISISNKEYPEAIHLNTVIVDQDNKEDVYSCVTVTAIPYVFAETSTEKFENKYYFIRDENYFYIAYLDYDTFAKLNLENIEENPIEICGMTKRVSADVKEIAIEVYNEAMEEEIVTNANFNDYFGEVYIDVVTPVNDNTIFICLALILALVDIILIVVQIVFKIKTNQMIKKIPESEWQQLNSEIEDPNTLYFKKAKIYFTKNYIVDFSSGMRVIKYCDILWMYPWELKQYGITTVKSIVIVNKDFKNYKIAEMGSFGKEAKETFHDMMEIIMDRNKDILLGFTQENQHKVKEMKKNKTS